jgi:hypothetical protein
MSRITVVVLICHHCGRLDLNETCIILMPITFFSYFKEFTPLESLLHHWVAACMHYCITCEPSFVEVHLLIFKIQIQRW